MFDLLVRGALIGLFATAAINLWAWVLWRLNGTPRPNRAMMGRWFAHIPRGKVFHDSIAAAPAILHETRIGWICHICVGATFGMMLAVMTGRDWLAHPTLWPALIWGIVTVGFGWFLMQPGMGAGIAGSRTPDPWKVRRSSLLGHVVFGLALWLGALILS